MFIIRKKIVLLTTLVLFCFIHNNGRAQDWEVGVNGGTSGYMGELNQDNPVQFNDWTLGLLLRKNLSRTWALRFNFLRANAHGNAASNSNAYIQQQQLHFKSPLYEASIVGEFNFFKFEPSYERISYTPYLFLGIGGFHFQPKSYNLEGDLVNLQPYQTEGVNYNRFALTIPFGVGFRYNLRGPWTIGMELGYRIAFTDYLDDISGTYMNPYSIVPADGVLGNEYVRQRMHFIDPSDQMIVGTQRGDGRKRDAYMLATFTVSYAIFRAGCPVYIKKN